MDEKTSRHFAEIIELAESVFENVTYEVDATPDRSILRINAEYGGENIPHLHREDKTQLYLTEEMTFAGFVDWLKINL